MSDDSAKRITVLIKLRNLENRGMTSYLNKNANLIALEIEYKRLKYQYDQKILANEYSKYMYLLCTIVKNYERIPTESDKKEILRLYIYEINRVINA